MLDLHPTIVEHDGVPIYVVLPYAEFQMLQRGYQPQPQASEADVRWEALLKTPKSQNYLNEMRAKISKDRAEGKLGNLLDEFPKHVGKLTKP
jgi:hypothetical protein